MVNNYNSHGLSDKQGYGRNYCGVCVDDGIAVWTELSSANPITYVHGPRFSHMTIMTREMVPSILKNIQSFPDGTNENAMKFKINL